MEEDQSAGTGASGGRLESDPFLKQGIEKGVGEPAGGVDWRDYTVPVKCKSGARLCDQAAGCAWKMDLAQGPAGHPCAGAPRCPGGRGG